MSSKKCSRCLTPFTCSNEQEGCWCEEIFIKVETLNELKKTFDNCLCPTCLKEYSPKEQKN